MPDENRAALQDAVAAGIQVALVTGRSFHHARPVALKISDDDTLPLIVSNGALIKRPNGETLQRRVLDPADVRELVVSVRARSSGAALIFDRPGPDQYVFEGIDWSHPNRNWYYERNKVFMTEMSPLEDALTEGPLQLAFTGGVEEMRQLAHFLRGLPPTRKVTLTLTEYEDRDFSLLDIIAGGCSKGSTLAAWVKTLGIRPEEVMAVGDNLNDREMLEFAGHPVVMGNALDELKTAGWPITASNDEGGLALAIRQVLDVSGGDASIEQR